MRKLLIAISLCLSVASAVAQCISKNTVVTDKGETLTYSAYFNWGAIWVKGGEAIFKANIEGSYYHYAVTAYTMPKWRWIYDLNTSIEAYMNRKTLKPVSFASNTTEDKKTHHEKITYKPGKLVYSYWGDSVSLRKTVEVDHPDCSYDLLNEVYASRDLDLSQFKIGEKIPFNVFFSDKMSTITGEIMGYETIKTRNGKSYNCIKCKSNSIPYSIFDATQPVYVWVTNTPDHVPVYVECKIKLGYIKVYLESQQ